MKSNEILDQLNNPSFKVDLTKMLYKTYQLSSLNNEYLKTLLEIQVECRELLKGKTESEIDDLILDKMEEIEKKIYERTNDKIPEDLDFFSSDEK